MTQKLHAVLATHVRSLTKQFDEIAAERRQQLSVVVDAARRRVSASQPIHLNFVCTHNSRRSQLAQVWATVASYVYDVPLVHSFSGGTEITAFNPRAVLALSRAGFSIVERSEGADSENPHYFVGFSDERPPIECFSKSYDDPANPRGDFFAIMTCGHADRNCPLIPDATRIALFYDDPKIADDTEFETARYNERSDQIGRELLWAFRQVRGT